MAPHRNCSSEIEQQQSHSKIGPHGDLAISLLNELLLLFLMIAIAFQVHLDQFKHKMKKPLPLFIAMFTQFILMPCVGYLIAITLLSRPGLPKEYAVGVIVMLCSPGGALSNILCVMFRGDIPLSIAMTATSSFLALGLMPLNMYIYLQVTGFTQSLCYDVWGIILSAGIVVVGTIIGLALRKSERITSSKLLSGLINGIGAVAGFGILILGFALNSLSPVPAWGAPGVVYAACVIPVIVGSFIGFVLATLIKLKAPSRMTVALETAIANKMIASATISVIFTGDQRDICLIIPILYSVFTGIYNFLFCMLSWKLGHTGLPADTKFCDILKTLRNPNKHIEKIALEDDSVEQQSNGSDLKVLSSDKVINVP